MQLWIVSLLNTNCSGDESINEIADSDNSSSTATDEDNYKPVATIYPKQLYGCKINKFFLDLKGWSNIVSSQQKAELYFQDLDMDGVRINIHGEDSKPAHPESGVVDSTYYTTMLQSIRKAKVA